MKKLFIILALLPSITLNAKQDELPNKDKRDSAIFAWSKLFSACPEASVKILTYLLNGK